MYGMHAGHTPDAAALSKWPASTPRCAHNKAQHGGIDWLPGLAALCHVQEWEREEEESYLLFEAALDAMGSPQAAGISASSKKLQRSKNVYSAALSREELRQRAKTMAGKEQSVPMTAAARRLAKMKRGGQGTALAFAAPAGGQGEAAAVVRLNCCAWSLALNHVQGAGMIIVLVASFAGQEAEVASSGYELVVRRPSMPPSAALAAKPVRPSANQVSLSFAAACAAYSLLCLWRTGWGGREVSQSKTWKRGQTRQQQVCTAGRDCYNQRRRCKDRPSAASSRVV